MGRAGQRFRRDSMRMATVLVLACVLLNSGFIRVALAEGEQSTDVPASVTAVAMDAGTDDEASAADAATAPTDALPSGAEDGSSEANATDQQEAEASVVINMSVTVRFVGIDGVWAEQAYLSVGENASVWDATRLALTSSSLTYHTGTTSAQDALVSITRPDTDETLSLDSSTGSGWHLYVNGERCLGSPSSFVLSEGDEVEWRYEIGTIMVSVSVVGPGGTGESYWIVPTSVRVPATYSVWDASLEVFSTNGYGEGRLLSYATGADGTVRLESLAALGENGITGESWQVFVNGVMPQSDAAHVTLHPGDSICWYYAGQGEYVLPSFVAQSGAASQDPATTISIDGVVVQAWSNTQDGTDSLFSIIDRMSGLALTGQSGAMSLLDEGKRALDPLAQLSGVGYWRLSLAHALDAKLSTGEGVRSAMGVDGSLYYLGESGSIVKLELR